jgi:iturin family lipopeptide synthetase A
LLTTNFETPFDLERQAPLRVQLLQVKAEKYILALVAHHLAIDGWSLARLLEHTCHAYNALIRNAELPHLPWEPYWGYLQEHERQLEKPAALKSRAHWAGKKFTAPPLLVLYEMQTKGNRVIYILNKKYYKKVKELAKAAKVTPFLFLLTCFHRALGKVLKREKNVISVPIAAREWPRAEFVVGTCVNLIPLELTLDSEGDLRRDLAHVKSAYVDCIGHAQVPMQNIQAEQPVDLTQIHFNFEPSVEEPELDGCEINFFPFPISQAEKPIIINVNDTKDTYYIEIDYQYQALDLLKALTLFTETERLIRQAEAPHTPAP